MRNLFLLLGTIIGAGMFSLPISLGRTGTLIFLLFTLALSYLLGKVNWFYHQVIEKVKDRHQLPGYVKKILGERASFVATISLLFSTFGALLAYLILSGQFISKIAPLSATQGSWLFYTLMFLLLFFGGRHLEVLDVFITIAKLLILGVVIVFTFNPTVLSASLRLFPAELGFKSLLLAYGAILFALTGYSIVPELKKEGSIRQSINWAQIISVVIYVFFAFNFLPFISGDGFWLSNPLHSFLFNLAGIFGVLTPYLMLSWVSYDLLDKDLGFPKKEALILTLVAPLLLYLLGLNDFMAVLSVSGGVFLGMIAILIAQMYAKVFPGKNSWLIRLIQVVFALGVVAEVASLI
jgi:tyrosine-specific transport protein